MEHGDVMAATVDAPDWVRAMRVLELADLIGLAREGVEDLGEEAEDSTIGDRVDVPCEGHSRLDDGGDVVVELQEGKIIHAPQHLAD